MSGTGGTPFGSYYTQTTTNLGLSPSFGARLPPTSSISMGNFNLTNPPGMNAPQMFYRLRLP